MCNCCHNWTIVSVNISHIAIITTKGVDYRCIIHDISIFEVINFLGNSVLDDLLHKK